MMVAEVKYKKTGIDWMPEVPEHWEVRRLKFLAEVIFSTVDKHSHKEEKQVRLCNYVDVYKYEYIIKVLDFMIATATDVELKHFTVEKGDVIITKDSETAADIAIPALVVEDLENVVCA
jgi:type I restriction enzyme, S subunit